MKKFALLAHPTLQSLSPLMWQAAFTELNLPYTYEAIDIEPEQFESLFEVVKKEYDGFSVSAPFKETILSLLDSYSDEVKAIGAVNTVKIVNKETKGENTDWIGVSKTLEKIDGLLNKKVLIYGAGGAAKSAVYALQTMGIVPYVYNRTPEKTEPLSEQFKIEVCRDSEVLPKVDLLINATSKGLNKEDVFPLSDSYLKQTSYVFDMVYGDTDLSRRARIQGCTLIDGKDMLLYQGIAQFELLVDPQGGLKAPMETMKKAIYLLPNKT